MKWTLAHVQVWNLPLTKLRSGQKLSALCRFVLLNWKGGLRKSKTWKGFRRDSKMISRMKTKTSEERWKELKLFAAFKRGRDVTINNLTERMVASCSQSEDNIQKAKWWEKRWWLSQAPVSRHATHSYSIPFTSLKFTYSYYLFPQHFSSTYCRPLTC